MGSYGRVYATLPQDWELSGPHRLHAQRRVSEGLGNPLFLPKKNLFPDLVPLVFVYANLTGYSLEKKKDNKSRLDFN